MTNQKSPQAASYEASYAEEAAIARAQALICWVMEQKNVSQKELADRLNVSEAAISKLLGSSPENLSVRRLARVLFALGDKLNISSELRDFASPHQPACGVRKQPRAHLWEDSVMSHGITQECYGGHMIFADILYSDNDIFHELKENVFTRFTASAPGWQKPLSELISHTAHLRSEVNLEDA